MAKKVAINRVAQLTAVANELQTLCEFDPPIKTKGKSEEDLEKLITEAAAQLTEEDEVTEETAAVLAELGIEISGEAEEAEEEEEEEVDEPEVPAEAPVKKKAAPAKKAAPTGEAKVKLSTVEKVEFFSPLIQSGKYTVKDLVAKSLEKFPTLSESSVRTFLVDSKNAKYNKFPKLVVADDEGKLSFAK